MQENTRNRIKGRIIETFGRQHRFAASLGISESLVSASLNGRRVPGPEEVRKWAELLQTDIERQDFVE